jgi:2-dehydro-3-deoxygluconokinase
VTAIGAIGEGLVELSPAGPDSGALSVNFGGDAANVAVMAARLGTHARFGGRVGGDTLGERLVEFWRRQGVGTGAVRSDSDGATGLYLNETQPDGRHRFTYWRTGSAGSRLRPGDLEQPFFDDLGILVVTGVTLAVSSTSAAAAAEAVDRARAAHARIACVLNHRPALGGDPAELAELARSADILIASADDADAVFGVADAVDLRALLTPGPAEVVVTAGARPAVALTADAAVRQPAPPVQVRNAAGAGDALAGAYLAARAGALPVRQSLRWGVAAASLSVQVEGCASAYPSGEETRAMAAQLSAVGERSEVGA